MDSTVKVLLRTATARPLGPASGTGLPSLGVKAASYPLAFRAGWKTSSKWDISGSTKISACRFRAMLTAEASAESGRQRVLRGSRRTHTDRPFGHPIREKQLHSGRIGPFEPSRLPANSCKVEAGVRHDHTTPTQAQRTRSTQSHQCLTRSALQLCSTQRQSHVRLLLPSPFVSAALPTRYEFAISWCDLMQQQTRSRTVTRIYHAHTECPRREV